MSLHYEKHRKNLENIVQKWTRLSNLGSAELMGEANLVYALCLKHYDPYKGPFYKYLYASTWNHVKRYVNRNKLTEIPKEMVHRFQPEPYDCPEKAAVFNNLLETLSDDAAGVVDCIFDANEELLSIVKQVGRFTRGILRTHFRGLKWSHHRIDKAFKEIEEVL